MSFSKKQNTGKASTFGAEIVAMCILVDMFVALWLKLKSISVCLLGLANIYCDNQGVVNKTSGPESVLSKKLKL